MPILNTIHTPEVLDGPLSCVLFLKASLQGA